MPQSCKVGLLCGSLVQQEGWLVDRQKCETGFCRMSGASFSRCLIMYTKSSWRPLFPFHHRVIHKKRCCLFIHFVERE